MFDASQHRRVETVVRPVATGPKPKWQDLFLAPAYRDDLVDEAVQLPPVGRRRRAA
ncbi:hypothetical protein [Streptomyces sp. NPDC048641]|uniref:hypothetical protein n=1 Tax=Streptomyces sp. NPDC048641 TaxID=3154825 RepID=UPI003412A935